MRDGIVIVFALLGLFFVASAALGTLRFPDVWTRMHAITKAGTLGVGLTMVAAAIYFGHDLSFVTRATAVILFTLLTAPASAQMIGRAAYLAGAPLAPQMKLDHLAEHYPEPELLFAASDETPSISEGTTQDAHASAHPAEGMVSKGAGQGDSEVKES